MRYKRLLLLFAFGFLPMPFVGGCSEGTEVTVQPAPPVQAPPPSALPEDPKKGGGAGSSGNMNFNPGASS